LRKTLSHKGRTQKSIFEIPSMIAGAMLFLLVCNILAPVSAIALASDSQSRDGELRVYMVILEPFVMGKEAHLDGFYVDLWEAISQLVNFRSRIHVVNSAPELVRHLEEGKADVGFTGLAMTPDLYKKADLSFPVFTSGLQIMLLNTPKILLHRVAEDLFTIVFSRYMLYLFMLLGLVAVFIGHVIWLCERGTNPDFHKGYLKGVGQGIWWAFVTVTTVGYGDATPRRALGRVFAVIFMVSGFLLLAVVTTIITTKLTIHHLQQRISGPHDLVGKRVVTLANTGFLPFLEGLKIKVVLCETVEDAAMAVEKGKGDCVVINSGQLRHFIFLKGRGRFRLVGEEFHKESSAISIPWGSPYRQKINWAILELKANGTYEKLLAKWFGPPLPRIVADQEQ
jgi:polar amino acid transport system substrate-binding protein